MIHVKFFILMIALATAPLFSTLAWAEETTGEKVGEVASDTKKAVKKGVRNMKDATCEMVNGKMECAGKKLKHKAQNAGDEIGDKADDVKKKVDN